MIEINQTENEITAKPSRRPEMIFAAFALVFGGVIACVTGPFQAPDEGAHFWRAYHLSEGHLMTSRKGESDIVGGRIPKDVAFAHIPYDSLIGRSNVRVDRDVLSQDWNVPFDARDKIFIDFFTPALFAPIVYVPQAVGIATARVFGLSALQMMYAGRFSALLCWIVLVAAAIRVVPVFKYVFVLVALLPRNISLAASLSADGPTNAIALLLTAAILHAVFSEVSRFRKWHLLSIVLLSILLSLAKQVYLPLAGLVLLIPAEKFDSWRKKAFYCGGVLTVSVLTTGLWALLVSDLYTPHNGANAPDQIAILMPQPWIFLAIAFKSFLASWVGIFVSFIGVLGFIDVWLPNWIYYTYPFVLLGVALLDADCRRKLPVLSRCWIILTCVMMFLLIELSMYLSWTQPGAPLVIGVHGRYFIPLAIPILLSLFYNRRLKHPIQRYFPLVVGIYSFCVLAVSCWAVYTRYYGPVSPERGGCIF